MSDYNARSRYGKHQSSDTPVAFRDGEPVFRGEKKYGEKKSYGERKQYGGKSYGEKRYGEKSYDRDSRNDKPSYGKKYGEKSYGEKKQYGGKSYGEKREKSYDRDSRDDQPSYGKKYGEKSYGEKKQYGERRYDREERPSYGKKPYERENRKKSDSYGRDFDRKDSFKKDFDRKEFDKNDSHGNDGYRSDSRQKDFDRRDSRKNDHYKKDSHGSDARTGESKTASPDELPYLIMGRNAVREAIKSGRSIDRILVVPEQDGSLREVIGLARDRNLVIREVERKKLDEMCMPFGHGEKTGNHQGIVAQVPGVEYCDVGDILEEARARGEAPFVILLDGIEDPHNLGSIIRSAECAGAHGVVITKRRSVSVTSAVAKASAGAVEYMKVAKVSNLANAIERLKQENIWVDGADVDGTPMGKANLKGPLALVIGNEGEGLSRLVREKCDFLVSIPMFGQVSSLNAAVAAAVLMYQKRGMDAE